MQYTFTTNDQAEAQAILNALATTQAPNEPAVNVNLAHVLKELNHPDYKLRRLSKIAEKVGMDEDEVLDLLDDGNVDYVEKTKRGTGDTLIGLAARQ